MQSQKRQLLYVLLLSGSVYADSITTENLVTDNWTLTGNADGHGIPGATHFHLYGSGGEIEQTIDLSAYTGQELIEYDGAFAWTSDGIDQIKVTLTLSTGETWTDVFNVGYQNQYFDLAWVPTQGDSTWATLSVFGQDVSGAYPNYDYYYDGPWVYTNRDNFALTYNPAVAVAEDPVILTTALDTVLMPDPLPVVDFSAPEIPVVSLPDPAPDPTPAAEAPQPTQASSDTSTSAAGGALNAGGGSENKSSNDDKPSGASTAVATVMADLDVATASVDSIAGDFGDPANPVAQVVMMAVMAAQGVQLSEAQLSEVRLPEARPLRDRGIPRRIWLGPMIDDAKWQGMVDSQWQN